jgi:hypothetical protein
MNRRFGGTYLLYLQGRKSAEQESMQQVAMQYKPSVGKEMLLSSETSADVLHGVVPQKMATFKTTAVRYSNPT